VLGYSRTVWINHAHRSDLTVAKAAGDNLRRQAGDAELMRNTSGTMQKVAAAPVTKGYDLHSDKTDEGCSA